MNEFADYEYLTEAELAILRLWSGLKNSTLCFPTSNS